MGLQLRAAHAFGSFDARARYAGASSSEQDFEEDVFAAARLPWLPSLQLAAFLPVVQTRRDAAGTTGFGGGIGDANVSARYDFYEAGKSRFVPGIAALAGVTFPTGTAPEDATAPLATDATGIGAFQFNVGLGLEQSFGPWLVTAYGIVAKRTARTIGGISSELGTQWTALASLAYTFAGDHAAALFASYTIEGNAELASVTVLDSSRRVPTVGLVGVLPFSDRFRLQGGPSLVLPIDSLGKNNLATLALTATAVYGWY